MRQTASNDVGIYTPSLGPREVQLLSEWERERRVSVTLEEVRKRVGAIAAKYVVRALVQKKVLQRLRRGTYLVRPLRTLLRPTAPSTAVAAAALLQREPYYLGGLWAVSFNRLSTQMYMSVVDAFITHRLAGRSLGAGRVHFHVLPERLLNHGIETTEMEGMAVRHSDTERTLLDGLDRPRPFGGLARSLELLSEHIAKIDHRKLIAYAVEGSKPSTCQRLGVLLERREVSGRVLAPLRSRARQTRSLLSMIPDERRTGAVNRQWNVVENDQ